MVFYCEISTVKNVERAEDVVEFQSYPHKRQFKFKTVVLHGAKLELSGIVIRVSMLKRKMTVLSELV